jgi:signal transduction histidine kinase
MPGTVELGAAGPALGVARRTPRRPAAAHGRRRGHRPGARRPVGRTPAVRAAGAAHQGTGRLDRAHGAGRPLPAPAGERREVREVRALREAMRYSSVRIAEARSRALEAERVRAWGEMARRVAHEMKNPLTPLRLAAHRLARHPDAAGPLREPLEVIEEEVGRLDELARQFAVLGGRRPGRPATWTWRSCCSACWTATCRRTWRRGSRVTAPSAWCAYFDALQRAFRNLIRNAVEAMDGTARPRLAVTVTCRAAGGLRIRCRQRLRHTCAARGAAVRAGLHAEGGWNRAGPRGGTSGGCSTRRHGCGPPRPEGGAEFTVDLPAAPPSAGRACTIDG